MIMNIVEEINDLVDDLLDTHMRQHTVKPKETLKSIAKHYYGRCDMDLFIYQHNRDVIVNPNAIFPGQVIVIPHALGCKMHHE